MYARVGTLTAVQQAGGRHRLFTILALSLICASPARGQTFDVISIRPQVAGDQAFFVRPPSNGRFTATGASAKLLLMLGYGITESQIEGGPSWLDTAKWNIEARAADGAEHSRDETMRMLQNLLMTRFALKSHRATKERSVYALVVAKNGPKVRVSTAERTDIRITGTSIDVQHGSLSAVAQLLASPLGRPVIDRTRLDGFYDFMLQWDDAPSNRVLGVDTPATADREHGSIFSAFQEQLGLRLEATRAPVEVIVIDRLEPASPN